MSLSPHFLYLKDSLKAAEDLKDISEINIANAETVGYKALRGVFRDGSAGDISFGEVLSRSRGLDCHHGRVYLQVVHDQKSGREIQINDRKLESSNVDTSEQMRNLVTSANITRSILAGLQVDNRIQQEILQLGR